MASASRSFARLARSAPAPIRSAASRPTAFVPRQAFRPAARRGYADSAPKSGSSNAILFSVLGLTAAGGAGYYFFANGDSAAKAKEAVKSSVGKKAGSFTPTFEDYQEVYNAVAERLIEFDEYDDGSYGPVVLRLGWHASGTFDAKTGTGGSNGATMRFAPEGDHGANAGLKAARDFLQPIKEQFPWITYSDLWTLATACAIQEMQGPTIPWRPGRADRDAAWCTPDGRLPDGAKEQNHLRAIFGRMGFNDQEIFALSGAHALGRCHTDRSGFEGPWTFSPTVLTNDYYKLLVEEKWAWKKWNGPKQYEDVSTKSLMMLPTDMALIKDKSFKSWVDKYAADNDKFFADFSAVMVKLLELGVPFTTSADSRFEFKPSS